MKLTAPIAMICQRRQVHVIDRNGTRHAQTIPGAVPIWGIWGTEGQAAGQYSWPTWSPDGRRIACFRLPGVDDRSSRVYVFDVGGVEAIEIADLGSRLPIYLFWSPDGARVAVLSQEGDRLRLSVLTTDRVAREHVLAEGTPLFFTWMGADKLAAYVGSSESDAASRLSVFHLDGRSRSVLPRVPGNFCAPVWLGDRVLYVAHDAGHSAIVTVRHDEPDAVELEQVDGLVALVASADRRLVARAVAADGDGTPYRDLAVVDVVTGEVRRLMDDPLLAYVWSPAGDALLVARVDTDRNRLAWERVGLDGHRQHLVDMHPTRDLGFYLRFFEQYAQSHGLVDPTGQHLLLSGGIVGREDPQGTPRLWQVSVDGDGVEELGDGLLGVYGPPGARVGRNTL